MFKKFRVIQEDQTLVGQKTKMQFKNENVKNKKFKIESFIENDLFQCEVCGREFRHLQGLGIHNRTH